MVKKRLFLYEKDTRSQDIVDICKIMSPEEVVIFNQHGNFSKSLKCLNFSSFTFKRKKQKIYPKVKKIIITDYEFIRKEVVYFLEEFSFPNLKEIDVFCNKAYDYFFKKNIANRIKELKSENRSKEYIFYEINKMTQISMETFEIFYFSFFTEPDVAMFVKK